MTSRQRHDRLFRKALENPLVAKEFFDAHLPHDVRAMINIDTLKLEKDSFVEQNLNSSITDVLFSTKFNDEDGYLYLLLEHQSTSDYWMAARLFRYTLNIAQYYLSLNPGAKHFPLIYPLVFFNGTERYNAPLNLWELFKDKDLAKSFWTNDYQLINVHDIPDEELKKRTWSGILEFFMKHIHERNLLKRWQEIADKLPELIKVRAGYDYIEILLYYTLTAIDKDDKIELEKMLLTHVWTYLIMQEKNNIKNKKS